MNTSQPLFHNDVENVPKILKKYHMEAIIGIIRRNITLTWGYGVMTKKYEHIRSFTSTYMEVLMP